MRMYNAKKIIPGLIVFLGVVTLPFWYNMGRAAKAPQPSLDTPVIQKMAKKQCVLPLAEMRTGHMQLLNDWRTEVVRNNQRVYVAADGIKYDMSLQNDCMRCHSNKAQFCDQCHDYAGLYKGTEPYCWTCHIAPKENK